jgi:hypothetical protein
LGCEANSETVGGRSIRRLEHLALYPIAIFISVEDVCYTGAHLVDGLTDDYLVIADYHGVSE